MLLQAPLLYAIPLSTACHMQCLECFVPDGGLHWTVLLQAPLPCATLCSLHTLHAQPVGRGQQLTAAGLATSWNHARRHRQPRRRLRQQRPESMLLTALLSIVPAAP